jgi:tetratricopeptide (TPR) repeat protein
MTKQRGFSIRLIAFIIAAGACIGMLWGVLEHFNNQPEEPVEGSSSAEGLVIEYPLEGSVFPPEIPAPTFRWTDSNFVVEQWRIKIMLADDGPPLEFVSDETTWTPSEEDWTIIKERSVDREAKFTIRGVKRSRPEGTLSSNTVSISTSSDEVGAPIFYREVNLPFGEAVLDPAAHIRWRFGTVDSTERPPIVLENIPVCGNCHSFSADGSVLGMDVDFGSDKGSYALADVSEEMVLNGDNIITWSDFEPEQNQGTFGVLSQVSPDGRYAVSTVKDQSIFIAVDDLEFSQLFFPVEGVLAYYDRQDETFHSLPGADDEQYVQSNPGWSPDGETIVYARSEKYDLGFARERRRGLLRPEDIPEFIEENREFKFDLWSIPFNEGNGGTPQPLEGASNNGMSNYFPKYSPDGKWIIFCRADNYMLLQPDSKLWIIPSEGGEARRLECNLGRMNSWHSWSPNGRWLVFSSKAYSIYTQLMLAHIDEEGHASPPILLSRFTASDMAANIPEFVNTEPDAIQRIRGDFISDHSYIRAGDSQARDGDFELAIASFRQALEMNPSNCDAYEALGGSLIAIGESEEAIDSLRIGLGIDPEHEGLNWRLGTALCHVDQDDEAVAAYQKAIEINPNRAAIHADLGIQLLAMNSVAEGRAELQEAIRLDPGDAFALYSLADSLLADGNSTKADELYDRAVTADPTSVMARMSYAFFLAMEPDPALHDLDKAIDLAREACVLTNNEDIDALMTLSETLAMDGRFAEACERTVLAIQVAEDIDDQELASAIRERLADFQRMR